MAEQPNKTEQKVTGGFLSEWFGLWTNRIKRWPLIRRFRFGRKQVGGRPVPIAYELDKKGWFKLNQNIFGTNLQTIEKYWDEEIALYGFGGDKEYIDGNPGGIIPIYKRFGVYSDIDRIKNEVQWFEHGTGYETEDITFEIPEDEREWKKIIGTEIQSELCLETRLSHGKKTNTLELNWVLALSIMRLRWNIKKTFIS